MRLGVMGGTFDPIHIGHLMAADEARCQFQLDKVVFVPSARPPHKTGVRHSPAADRMQMVRIAIRGNQFLDASDVELNREGLSYTIDTLRHLREVHGAGVELFFITGADAILEILTWKDPDELLAESAFIAATRPGFPLASLRDALPEKTSKGKDALDNVYSMEIPALAISSTDIRERAASGRPYRYMVPEGVWEYIEASGLYLKGEPSGDG